MLKIELVGGQQAVRALRALPAKLRERLQRALKRSAVMVESEAKRIVYGGPPDHLTGRSGRLRQSITHEVYDTHAAVGTNVVYGRIHEQGGRTAPHIIRPVNARALRFEVNGNVVFAAYVNHPGSEIRARPYLAPALQAKRDAVRDEMEKAVREVLP